MLPRKNSKDAHELTTKHTIALIGESNFIYGPFQVVKHLDSAPPVANSAEITLKAASLERTIQKEVLEWEDQHND
jgi:hypothetical protein